MSAQSSRESAHLLESWWRRLEPRSGAKCRVLVDELEDRSSDQPAARASRADRRRHQRALVSLVDERGVVPIVILDDAQGLRDDLLHELHGLTSLDFDGREYLTIWLVGHPLLARRLRLQQHAALAQRVVIYAPLLAKTDPLLFDAMLDHGLAAAAASAELIPADARSLIQRVTRGIPRLISHLLRIALTLADERGLTTIDINVVNTAAILLHLEPPKPPSIPPPKPRYDRDSRSRG